MFTRFVIVRQRRFMVAALVVAVLLLSGVAAMAQGPQPQDVQANLGSGFTYQGQLKNGSTPFSGSCNMQFSLWDSQTNNTGQIGNTDLVPDVNVSNGLFTTIVNSSGLFGLTAFNGEAR